VARYVVKNRLQLRTAAYYIETHYSEREIEARKRAKDAARGTQEMAVPTGYVRVESSPENATFRRLMVLFNDAVEWDLSLFSDEGRLLHAQVLLYATWLMTDPEAGQRGVALTGMEQATFELGDAPHDARQEDDFCLDRLWVRMSQLDRDNPQLQRLIEQVRIALFEVRSEALPNKAGSRKTRGIGPAELRAAASYRWLKGERPDLYEPVDGKRLHVAQWRHIREVGCSAYAGARVPKTFETWATQARKGLKATERPSPQLLDRAARASEARKHGATDLP
jgi:hypothetical protein